MIKLLAPILLVTLFFSCKKKEEKTNPIKESITESVYASGIIKSKNQYQVFSAVGGVIKEIYVTEGDLVQKGDPLFKLSDATAKLNTENARIAATYNSLSISKDKLSEIKFEIETAKAKMDNDASLVEKQRSLWAQGIGTRNELEQRELAYKSSSNGYSAARLRYKQVENQLTLLAKQTETNLAISNSNKADLIVKSEFNGKVYAINKKLGEMVNSQNPIATIGEANGFTLELQVDEYDIARVKPGQKILLNMDSYKNQVFEAVLVKINPAMNAQSKSFTIDAAFVKPPPALFPNLTTEANIIIQVKENVITIPRNYLIDDQYVLLENKEKRKLQIGLKDYQKAEIISGLSITDVIIKPLQ